MAGFLTGIRSTRWSLVIVSGQRPKIKREIVVVGAVSREARRSDHRTDEHPRSVSKLMNSWLKG